jgi:hypothetical protein
MNNVIAFIRARRTDVANYRQLAAVYSVWPGVLISDLPRRGKDELGNPAEMIVINRLRLISRLVIVLGEAR